MTSLNRGLPSRETCTQGPASWISALCSRIFAFRRLAEAYTPMSGTLAAALSKPRFFPVSRGGIQSLRNTLNAPVAE